MEINKIEPIIDISENVIGLTVNDLLDVKVDLDDNKIEIDKHIYTYKDTEESQFSTCYLIFIILYYNCCKKKI